MKCRMFALLMTALMIVSASAFAQMVSVSELYDQAQAMSGWWKEIVDTPNGKVEIDAPIIVPDVDAMPVLTMEGAKISEELYHHILRGRKGEEKDDILYDEVELGGKSSEFFLGRENDYVNGVKTKITGYDAVDILWIQHGAYRFSQGVARCPALSRRHTIFRGRLILTSRGCAEVI